MGCEKEPSDSNARVTYSFQSSMGDWFLPIVQVNETFSNAKADSW